MEVWMTMTMEAERMIEQTTEAEKETRWMTAWLLEEEAQRLVAVESRKSAGSWESGTNLNR